MRKCLRAVLAMFLAVPASATAQTTPLLRSEWFHSIRDESSGERPFADFNEILSRFSGFMPSKGSDETAEYLAQRFRAYGLSDVKVEGFPADGKTYFWAFITEPYWEGEVGVLTMVEPQRQRLADFAAHRVVLGRFSSSGSVRAELVDVGDGTAPADYAGKNVRGKIVLASGVPAGRVHSEAVWKNGAAGVVWFRPLGTDQGGLIQMPQRSHLIHNPSIVPWRGPAGESPGFAFGVSYETGMDLRRRLQQGARVTLEASVKATTAPGEYKLASAAIPGTDPGLPEVWVNAHYNYRNTGGGNNLTGVGHILETARVLQTLIAAGTLPRPRRTIRFLSTAEHYGTLYNFYKYPERRGRSMAVLNVDMTGFHQERAKAVFRIYRLPHSFPHFLSDVCEEFIRSVGYANSTSIAKRDQFAGGFPDPIFAPTGSRDQLHWSVEDFWGPNDAEELNDPTIGVPTILYNDWPSPFIGSQEDGADKGDPTQMRRSIVTVAATAYYLAHVNADGVAPLANLMVANAQIRLVREARRAADLMGAAPSEVFFDHYREARNILAQAIKRELATVDSIERIDVNPAVTTAIARSRKQLEAMQAANEAAFRDQVAALAASKNLTMRDPVTPPALQALEAWVPKRTGAIQGPVNIFRPEYGQIWLQEKTGDEDFLSKLRLAAKGRFVFYEALNFADGRRTLLEIRDAVSAEYGPQEAQDIEQYFRLLEKVGVVSISPAVTSRPSGTKVGRGSP